MPSEPLLLPATSLAVAPSPSPASSISGSLSTGDALSNAGLDFTRNPSETRFLLLDFKAFCCSILRQSTQEIC
ncbi:hypothetical protein LXL04_037969 [Taraxacum kok-saghyz]